jgi:hypothetical protein
MRVAPSGFSPRDIVQVIYPCYLEWNMMSTFYEC